MDIQLTPDRITLALAPVLDRVRRVDHWYAPKKGDPSHRESKLTDALMASHVLRTCRIGACPIERGASTTRLALFDLDSHKGDVPWREMQALARRMIDLARMLYGIRLIPFRSSGGHGIHLYAIWSLADDGQDAHSVRMAFRDVLAGVGMGSGTQGVRQGKVEIFPKQPRVPKDGSGSMFVLPMSNASEPLCADSLAGIHLLDVGWRVSEPVPVVLAPVYDRTECDRGTPEFERVRSALLAIDPDDLGYGADGGVDWLELLFAVHDATEGGAEGLALMHEWSSGWFRYDTAASPAETEKQWNAAKPRPGGITAGTLFKAAINAGWKDPNNLPTADGFTHVPGSMKPSVRPPLADLFRITHYEEGTKRVSAISEVRDDISRFMGDLYAYDDFTAQVVFNDGGEWRPTVDEDISDLRMALEKFRGFKEVGSTVARDAINAEARERTVDSAQIWLHSRPRWDGVSRIERLLPDYMSAEDTPYTRAIGRYLMTALAGRILDPGCQVEMVPVLIGAQGIGKTQSVKALVPDSALYAEIDLTKRDADQARLLRGKVIGEIAELKGLAARDHESIKAWITRGTEEWTPKYRESNIVYRRRIVLVGTANVDEFLDDETGNRRWLPVAVGQCWPERIREDRDQLWAEAAVLYLMDGIDYAEADALAVDEHRHFTTTDPWADAVAGYLEELEAAPQPGRGSYTVAFSLDDVFAHALLVEARDRDMRGQWRLGRVLRALGYTKFRGLHPVTKRSGKLWHRLTDVDYSPAER